ncbi:hypothetical protein MKX08_009172 [Trichoderma sp. CBMAI-0020]|nr:hypothetical protein MKX08_009172 [Trichoderma sp. CBMAI-0020]
MSNPNTDLRPINQLHPVLRRLIERMIDLPEGYEASLTERQLTRTKRSTVCDSRICNVRFCCLQMKDKFLLRITPIPDESDTDRESNSDDTSILAMVLAKSAAWKPTTPSPLVVITVPAV